MSRTVKTRKFKLLYFRNKARYGNENLYKDLLFVYLQPSANKKSQNLAFLTLQFHDFNVKRPSGAPFPFPLFRAFPPSPPPPPLAPATQATVNSELRILQSPSIIRNNNRRTQNPSQSLKKPLLRQKDDTLRTYPLARDRIQRD